MDSKIGLVHVSAFGLLLASCNNPRAMSKAVGHFEGFEVVSQSSQPGFSTQVSVGADVEKVSDTVLDVTVNTEPATQPIKFEVETGQSADIELSSPSGYIAQSIAFNHSTGNCFLGQTTKDEICISGNELQLSLVAINVKFVLDKMPARTVPTMETPAAYTVDQLIARAENEGFATQAAFQSMVQAKLTADQAEMNLLPHVNINSALGIESLSLTTMARSIGDLIPFVLPNRWFEAAALKNQSVSDIDAYKIVQASAMNIAQGLALSVLRDEESLRTLQENEVNIIQIRDQVLASELQGASTLQLGDEASINVLLDTVGNSIATLQEAIVEEKAALSQACGFYNTQAVSEVLPITLTPVTGPLSGTATSWESTATSRSLQLSQADAMIAAAKDMKGEKEFEWLDPSGDDDGSVGFGLVDHIKIQSSTIDQLVDLRESAQGQIIQQVDTSLSQSGTLFTIYQNDYTSSRQGQTSINLYLYKFQNGQSFDMSSFATVLGQKADSDVAQVNDLYAYTTLKAQMDFLTFSGVYAELISENP